MCGICGVISLGHQGPPVDRQEILLIRDRMVNRGPDGSGLWFSTDATVALGHRRLSIIDLSEQASQPMTDSGGRLTIVFNGEIYNYAELRKQLTSSGYKFRSNGDTEVLLALYERHGSGMLDFLRGMFAFAIWDDKKKELFLARDHFGIKPLYYSNHGGYFRFASQVKALLKSGALPKDNDQAGQAGFFLLGYVPEPHTFFRKVRSLPAGSAKLIDRSGREKDINYFDIADEAVRAEALLSNGQYGGLNKEELHSILKDTINYHMVSDVPVGVFLSSGTDSSVIAALSIEQKSNLKTITLGFSEFKGQESDEVPLAERTAKALKSDHVTQWISKNDFNGQYQLLMEAMDQPSIDGVNTFFVSRAAHQNGLKVALSGLGGDELCGSYPSFGDVPKIAHRFYGWGKYPRLAALLRKTTEPILKGFTSPKYAGLAEYGGSYGGAYLLRRGLFMPWELPELMGKDQSDLGMSELDLISRLNKTVESIKTPRLKVSALEMSWYMKNQLLRDSDWAGMAHSLEIRVPWVDVKLFRSLLPAMARRDLNKKAMISTVADVLPAEIRKRKRTGFSVPVRDWLMDDSNNIRHKRGLRGWADLVYRSARS